PERDQRPLMTTSRAYAPWTVRRAFAGGNGGIYRLKARRRREKSLVDGNAISVWQMRDSAHCGDGGMWGQRRDRDRQRHTDDDGRDEHRLDERGPADDDGRADDL